MSEPGWVHVGNSTPVGMDRDGTWNRIDRIWDDMKGTDMAEPRTRQDVRMPSETVPEQPQFTPQQTELDVLSSVTRMLGTVTPDVRVRILTYVHLHYGLLEAPPFGAGGSPEVHLVELGSGPDLASLIPILRRVRDKLQRDVAEAEVAGETEA